MRNRTKALIAAAADLVGYDTEDGGDDERYAEVFEVALTAFVDECARGVAKAEIFAVTPSMEHHAQWMHETIKSLMEQVRKRDEWAEEHRGRIYQIAVNEQRHREQARNVLALERAIQRIVAAKTRGEGAGKIFDEDLRAAIQDAGKLL